MHVKRFLKIHRYVNDNSQTPPRSFEYFYVIRFIITHLKNVYHSSRYLAIDENTVAYKGRSTMKQYVLTKPNKLWVPWIYEYNW